jgi:hypothetical protein
VGRGVLEHGNMEKTGHWVFEGKRFECSQNEKQLGQLRIMQLYWKALDISMQDS